MKYVGQEVRIKDERLPKIPETKKQRGCRKEKDHSKDARIAEERHIE